MDFEKWLLVHEDLAEDGSIMRWQWCGLFKTREPALKLLKKNVKRIIDEYGDTFPEIVSRVDSEEIDITIGKAQRFKLILIIEEP